MENLPNFNWIKSEKRLSEYQAALLDWYHRNKRILPWRQDPSLYKTVVSEFMLQQTRVSTVLPYFENWLQEFPDFESLAKAPEEKVLKAWEGLGYYSRARNLSKLAKISLSWEKPPGTFDEWKKLPGVGPYIAAAVTSISLDKREAVCDGNVVRVLSRVFAIPEIYKDGATAQKKIRPFAQSLISKVLPGDYNQAIMELGATLCLRSSPLCSQCPIHKNCKSGKSGDWHHYPRIAPRLKKTAIIRRYWVEKNGSLLLHSSREKRLRGIFELPETLPPVSNFSKIKTKEIATRKRTIGNVEYTEEIHRTIIQPTIKEPLPNEYQWMKWSEMKSFTLSGPHRKWIDELRASAISPKMKYQRNHTSHNPK